MNGILAGRAAREAARLQQQLSGSSTVTTVIKPTTIGIDLASGPDITERTIPVYVAEGYDSLFMTFAKALEQAQAGKGKERHAEDADGKTQPFEDQDILTICKQVGLGFATGQAIKKTIESQGMMKRGQIAAAERELLGAIVYLAAGVIRLNQMEVETMD